MALLIIADAIAVAFAWVASYSLRFAILPASKGIPELQDKFLPLLPAVVIAHLIIFYRFGLYRPRRDDAWFRETRDIFKAFLAAIIVVVLLDYFVVEPTNKISRQFIAVYAVFGTALFAIFRGVMRAVLRYLRGRGWNRRFAAIVGSGRNAQRLAHALHRNSWTGLTVAYFVDDLHEDRPAIVRGVPVRGPLSDLRQIVEANPVDQVFIALPTEQQNRVNAVFESLRTSTADVRLVPEIAPNFAMRPNVSQLDGVAILSLRQTPLTAMSALLKRVFDLVVAAFCLLVAAVPMLIIAMLVKFGSRGPIFYYQRRVGLDGEEFWLIKFRTMGADAEKNGPGWSTRDDPRRTRIGAFLRRTSLDELPNLFNVLIGNMSIVGPRPERPEFIRHFKEEIPQYMLRHKVKAGMTGLAQMRGFRGDTSIRKRIQHDLHYIRHWSLALDCRIFFATIGSVWFSRHET